GELVRLLRAAGVAAERVRELDEALYGEQARRRDLLPERPSRRGTGVQVLATPYRLGRTPARVSGLIGEPGADGEAILAELGYAAPARAALRSQGVVL
ncbi:MAG: CoA transferase, partial [Candidatus Lambdaproteobacteria bacterium]|nr:CoA transferase [Candidatus Lambdaproteobacteria bacterium]